MTTKRQLRADLEAVTDRCDSNARQAAVASAGLETARRDIETAASEAADMRHRIVVLLAELAAANEMIAERDTALEVAAIRRSSAERHACEVGTRLSEATQQIEHLKANLQKAIDRGYEWRGEAQVLALADTVGLMTKVGDRMLRFVPADHPYRREWAAALEGRALRGPDGRWLKDVPLPQSDVPPASDGVLAGPPGQHAVST